MRSFNNRRRRTRRHRATIKKHDGTIDGHGVPTISEPTDWDAWITDWPVEVIAVSGGEAFRGRQVADSTTHVIFGEYHGGDTITPEMQCVINAITYEIVSVLDVDGDSRELRVELKREL